MEPPKRKVMNIEQARAAVGVTRRTMYQWIEKGHVQVCRTASGAIRVYADTLYRDDKVVR